METILHEHWQDYMSFYDVERPYQYNFIEQIVDDFYLNDFGVILKDVQSYASVGHGKLPYNVSMI